MRSIALSAVFWIILFCLAGVFTSLAEDTHPPGYTVGHPWTGPEAVRRSTTEIQESQREFGLARARKVRHYREVRRLGELPQNPDSPSTSGWVSSQTNEVSTPQPAVTSDPVALSFTGATLNDTLAFPPDTMGTVGPEQFIVAVNGRIRSFNKQTGQADNVINVDPDVFFASVMTPPIGSNFTSDPRIRYDRFSGRWFILIIDVPGGSGTQPNRILLAVSDSGVISASTIWNFFQFQHDLVSPTGDTGAFADYPTLGVDTQALYVGVNVFATRGLGSFDNTSLFVIRKSSVLGAGPIVVTAFRDLVKKVQGIPTGPYTPQGVDNFDVNATEGYVIGVDAGLFGRMQLRRISNPGGTPSISGNITITTPTTSQPLTVQHLGNTGGTDGNLDGLDFRLIAAHVRNGRLWTAHNVGVDNTGVAGSSKTRNGVRWYELQGIGTGFSPSIVQSGTVFQGSGSNTTDQRNYWMGSMMTSGQGHVLMGFSAAGVSEYVNAAMTYRLSTDVAGTMQTPALYTASSSAYNPPSNPGGPRGRRWGDYSYTSVDPDDDMTLWTIQEWCHSQNSYAVQVLKVLAPPPATPISASPSQLAAGASGINVSITGMSTNGSGFFDPGTNFPKHIAATVSGSGITVNSVSYLNPTNITLNLTIDPGAAAGARSLTIINPDGQSATSSSGILVVAASTNNPPTLAAIADKTVDELSSLSFFVSATDPDAGDTVTYSFTNTVPAGASINATNGQFAWIPTEEQGPGVYTITVLVTDSGNPALTDTETFSVTVNETNSSPALAAIPNKTIHAGTTLTLTNSATDLDVPANVLTFELLSGFPSGATLNSTNGVFTWTPGDEQTGEQEISIGVTDDGSPPLADTETLTVSVMPRPLQTVTLLSSEIVITWNAIPGNAYRLQFKNDLDEPQWNDVGLFEAVSSSLSFTNGITSSSRFYRIAVE